MAKTSIVYKCSECEATSPKWSGRCLACNAWGTIEEVANSSSVLSQNLAKGVRGQVVALGQVSKNVKVFRLETGIKELDRCLGGGFVPGSVVLLGGDPGVGKSTLALQMAGALLDKDSRTLYVAGEESASQIKMRAQRLGLASLDQMSVLMDSNLANILATAAAEKPEFLIVDSIQTVYNPESSSVPGSISQVSGATSRLVELAKTNNITTLLIGHVTKEGFLAGPKTLEHAVDVVLYVEGDRFQDLRLLRAVKNRFGGVNEVGVFEMVGTGLHEVSNPSRLFIDEETANRSGTAYTAILEGTRVLASEIQALLSKSGLAYPKRTAVGFDQGRLGLLLAVLARHGKLPVHEQDVYVNVIGGLKISEPAADLAVAAAIAGSLLDSVTPEGTAVFGEIGLSGEVRPVGQIERRLSEVERLGFEKAVIPGRQKVGKTKLELVRVGDVKEMMGKVFGKKR